MSPTYSVCKNHGYLTGEYFSCPSCGETAEVYSRITGYYRPVQNWNAGKTQEYKDRTEYDINHSHIEEHRHSLDHGRKQEESTVSAEGVLANGIYLFTSKTCPNCKIARKLLEDNLVEYEELDAQENKEVALKLGVRQAPTLVSVTPEGTNKVSEAGAIKSFILESVKA
jgi:ribonucleoside-triphosphate reductase